MITSDNYHARAGRSYVAMFIFIVGVALPGSGGTTSSAEQSALTAMAPTNLRAGVVASSADSIQCYKCQYVEYWSAGQSEPDLVQHWFINNDECTQPENGLVEPTVSSVATESFGGEPELARPVNRPYVTAIAAEDDEGEAAGCRACNGTSECHFADWVLGINLGAQDGECHVVGPCTGELELLDEAIVSYQARQMDAMANLLLENASWLSVNESRYAVQALGCSGEVLQHWVYSPDEFSELKRALARATAG